MDAPDEPDPPKPRDPIAGNALHILEQYKVYMGDLGNIGARYGTANGFFVSVISALLAVLALTKKDEGYSELKDVLGFAIPLFAILMCWVWFGTMRF